MQKEGLFIAMEGVDGSGKSTQFKLLVERLELAGYEVVTFDFPRYQEPSSYFVRQYLNGVYGNADEVGPYTASLFYALDRYEAATQIRKALAQGKIVLADRFTGSNMAHQGTKFSHADERRGFFIWLDNLEFEMLRIPRPDLNLVLRVPADVAQEYVNKREKRDYTYPDRKLDIHEEDINHLRRAVEVFDDLCQLFPRDYVRIDCVRGDKILPIETVSNLLWEKVFPFLPKPTRSRKTAKAQTTEAATVSADNPSVDETEASIALTDIAETPLTELVTDPDGPVYGLLPNTNIETITAALARLARRDDGLRTILMDEFAQAKGKDTELLQRTIAAYGDNSVTQLAGVHLVIEGVSNLLAKKLERGRIATYLEQSTRSIRFDEKDTGGKYKYYMPDYLDDATKAAYRQHMDKIFGLYTELVQRLTHYVREQSGAPKAKQDTVWHSATRAQAIDAARAVLPVAIKTTVGIYASTTAIESMVVRLQSDELPEAHVAADRLLAEARKLLPTILHDADTPERSGDMITYRTQASAAVKKLADQYLPDNHADPNPEPIDLVEVWPRNELHIVPDMLYEQSNRGLRELQSAVESWPYDKKVAVLQAYMGKRQSRQQLPGRALEKIHYSWDLVSDYDVFRDLARHRMVDDLEWQQLTPRYGFDVPKLIDDAGLTGEFEECFDTSLNLHSILQAAGFVAEAQYATLLGHKLRWKVTYNAREAFHIHELRTSPLTYPNTRKFAAQLHQKVAEAHPLLAEAMKFVGNGVS